MKINYGQLRAVYTALQSIMAQKCKFATARRLYDVQTALAREARWHDEQLLQIQKEYVQLDQAGNPVPARDADGNPLDGQYVITDPAGYAARVMELYATETGELPPLDEDMLTEFEISGEELSALMMIIGGENNGGV